MVFKYIFVVIAGLLQLSNCWLFNDLKLSVLRGFQKEEIEKESTDLGTELKMQNFSLIYPGTKWCGPGNIADNYDDLGPEVETDKCCRAHDNCPEVIEAKETKHNLTNDAFYSRLSCNCDETFRHCLQKDGSNSSVHIGHLYFDLIGTQCYREDYRVIGCKKRVGFLVKKCVEYDFDTNSNTFYQWFDVPYYKS